VATAKLSAVELDFDTREERSVSLERAFEAMKEKRFVWLDLECDDKTEARESLASLKLFTDEVVEDCLHTEPSTQHARYPDYIHLVVSGCRQRGDAFDLERVDVLIGQCFLVTFHRAPAVFLDAVKRDYGDDFRRFARSPSFLVYELWDHLLDNYLSVQKRMEERVEAVQRRLIGKVDDAVFAAVSDLGADLLHFRKVLLPARSVLADLSTRKTLFISEATQPYLANMGGTLEHVLQDLLVDRDILSESLNLYMSMVGHRTNEVMKRLTVVSVVFLPLTFLCGVYGMNFERLPELTWNFGYAYFWALVLVITVGLLSLLRRAKMI
jgi:magnesium transporter